MPGRSVSAGNPKVLPMSPDTFEAIEEQEGLEGRVPNALVAVDERVIQPSGGAYRELATALLGSIKLKEIQSRQKHDEQRDERRFYSQRKNACRHFRLQMDIDRHRHVDDEAG